MWRGAASEGMWRGLFQECCGSAMRWLEGAAGHLQVLRMAALSCGAALLWGNGQVGTPLNKTFSPEDVGGSSPNAELSR